MDIKVEHQSFSSTNPICEITLSVKFGIEISKLLEIWKGELNEEILIELMKNKKQ
jgi:hypothetical protein